MKNLFARHAGPPVPPTHLPEKDVMAALGCTVGVGKTQSCKRLIGAVWGAEYAIRNQLDGKTLEVEIYSWFGAGECHTRIVAEQAAPGVLDIKSILFDGEPETPHHRKEIFAVLNYIGGQIRQIDDGEMPTRHQHSEEFSRFGRFMTRLKPTPKPDF